AGGGNRLRRLGAVHCSHLSAAFGQPVGPFGQPRSKPWSLISSGSLRAILSWQMTGMARPNLIVDVPGFAARRIAADILESVLRRRWPLDEELEPQAEHADFATLSDRDRALVRALVTVALRRLGTLRHLLTQWVKFPADARRVETALLLGAAQTLWLDVANHAAVDLAVRLVQADRRAAHYAGLVNAVLRRVTREGAQSLAAVDTTALDTPEWLM